MKKVLAALVALVFAFALVPASAYASDDQWQGTDIEAIMLALEKAQGGSSQYIWIRLGPLNGRGGAAIVDNFYKLCSWAYHNKADFTGSVASCMDRQETFRIRTWTSYCACEDAWFRVVLSPEELLGVIEYAAGQQSTSVPVDAAHDDLSALLERVLEGQVHIESRLVDLAESETRGQQLQEPSSVQEEILERVEGNHEAILRVEEKVDLLSSRTSGQQEVTDSGSEEVTTQEPLFEDLDEVTNWIEVMLQDVWQWAKDNVWALVVIFVLLAVVLALLVNRKSSEPRQNPAPVRAPAGGQAPQAASGQVTVTLQPATSPYTSALVRDAKGGTHTLVLSKVAESVSEDHKGEAIYKTPYATRVREENLDEHIKKQWQKTHV